MSGPGEVDVLVDLIADGVREKMLRPKCLARSSWLDDTYLDLGRRVLDELRETEAELGELVEVGDWSFGLRAPWAVRVFRETCDVVAFGAMLKDKSTGRRPGQPRVVA
ncbi:MAG: hypothetical protein L3K23_10470 [Thermoplasmata archaeon]|nr:hypothetical protein [Thermoplasmata archaeon]